MRATSTAKGISLNTRVGTVACRTRHVSCVATCPRVVSGSAIPEGTRPARISSITWSVLSFFVLFDLRNVSIEG